MNISIDRRYVPFAILAAGVFFAAIIIGHAFAQTGTQGTDTSSIVYPIAELGNCGSKSECKTYCDEPDNLDACISFAEKNNLMPPEEIATAKKFLAAGGKGPGGCTGKDSCEAYCNEMTNIDECVAFAEKSGIMPPKELDEAKKVQAAIKRGVKPPPCGGKRACDAYCEDPNHIEECVAFASEAGFMSPDEQANAQKMVQAIKSGVKPLPCRGKEECDAYCGQEENIDTCVAFAEAAGFMTGKDAEMARKTRGKGPGGCRGKEECDAFCDSSPENQETCFQFGKDNGLISPEEEQRMEKDNGQLRESLSNPPPETVACLENIFGKDNYEKLKAGAIRPTRDLGEKMSACFSQQEERRIQGEERNDANRGPDGRGRHVPQEGPCEDGNCPQYDPSLGGPAPRGGCEGENCGPRDYPPGPRGPRCEGENCPPPGDYPPNPGPGGPRCEGENCPPPGDHPRNPGPGGPPCEGGNCPPPGDYPRNPEPPRCEGGNCPPPGDYPRNPLPSGCTGENCAPPPIGSQPQGEQIGQIPQGEMQQFIPPTEAGYPPPESGTQAPPPPPSDGGAAPAEPATPAPAQEPAPTSEPISAYSPSAMVASVVNFFLSPLFVRQQ
ncbi:MAG: proline-rich domain-containing protein [bacterium]|nr:proline-rich domain-containing protein [bacterium]